MLKVVGCLMITDRQTDRERQGLIQEEKAAGLQPIPPPPPKSKYGFRRNDIIRFTCFAHRPSSAKNFTRSLTKASGNFGLHKYIPSYRTKCFSALPSCDHLS